jgi:alkylhydroperoxidase family enzyme
MTEGETRALAAPRIAPGSREEIGSLNTLIGSIAARVIGTVAPPHLFTTLARHRRLFRPWLRFAGVLMPGGVLPRRDTELVILRVAANCDCEYERRHHEPLGRRAGLTAAEVDRVRDGPAADGWSDRDGTLLRAVDELHETRRMSDELWQRVSAQYSEVELIELCMLVGHYEMLAMTINSVGIQPDRLGGRRRSLLTRLAARRR